MAHIKIKKGLDIPIAGKPEKLKPFSLSSSIFALDLKPLTGLRLRLLKKEGENILQGEPLLEDKDIANRIFISPTCGKILQVRRGKKLLIESVVIEKTSDEHFDYGNFDLSSKEQILQTLCKTGLLSLIRMRPFDFMARSDLLPKKIFIKAIESAPFVPSAEMQVEGYDKEFQKGLSVLSTFVEGNIYLVFKKGTSCKAFTEAKDVKKHTTEGVHPVGNSSVHIHHIDPIKDLTDITWTLTVQDVISIGFLIENGKHFLTRIVAIAGDIDPSRRGYYKMPLGVSIKELIKDIDLDSNARLISGDPLMGKIVTKDDFLGFFHTCFCVINQSSQRKFLHFLRLGKNTYTATGAYLSAFLNKKKLYSFTTALHGEERAFIDPNVYDRLSPMNIPIVPLIKAVLAEDFETAKMLGLLEIAPEDFALPTFICPSKIEMVEIIEKGLKRFSEQNAF